jgi:hypothetical protein
LALHFIGQIFRGMIADDIPASKQELLSDLMIFMVEISDPYRQVAPT